MNRGDILSGMFDISADEITAVSAGASVRRYRRSRRAMKKTIAENHRHCGGDPFDCVSWCGIERGG
jgi:hypothetical protein